MKTVEEIESAITQLPESQLNELANWLEQLREQKARIAYANQWLMKAEGAATSPGVTTHSIMALTRGEE